MSRLTVVALMLLAIHVAVVILQFPPRHASSGDPLATGDLSFYLASAFEAEAGGRLSGYSPSYMAGYEAGGWTSLGRKGYELAALWLPGAVATRFYATVVLFAAIPPFLLAAAGRVCSRRLTAAAAASGVVVYQLCDPVSFFWTFGNVAWPCAGAMMALGVAVLSRGSWRAALLAGILGGAAAWLHTVAVVVVAVGYTAATLAVARSHGWRRAILGLGLAAVVAALLTIPGHLDYLGRLGDRVPMRIHPLPSGIKYLMADALTDRGYGHPFDRRPLFHVVVVLAAAAAVTDWRARRRGTLGLALAGFAVLLFGYAAGQLPGLKELQPYRFVVSADLLLVVPAAAGAHRLAAALRGASPRNRLAAGLISLAFLPSLTGYLFDAVSRRVCGGLAPDSRACLEYLRDSPLAGRVACEPAALGNLLPHLAGVEVIGGGLSGHAVVPQGWAHLETGWAFGRPLDRLDPAEFLESCRVLHVRRVVAESDSLKTLLSRLPARQVAEFGRLSVYELSPTPSESWRVVAGPDRLIVYDAPAGRIVLPYHYASGWRGPSGVTIAPASLPGVPVPMTALTCETAAEVVTLTFGPD